MKIRQQSGFSFIELVLVIVIVAVASVPILGQFNVVARSAVFDEDIQTAAQLAQGQAEEVLARRRTEGYAAVIPGITNVDFTGSYANYSSLLIVSDPTAIGGCFVGATCKSVVVTVSSRANKLAQIEYLLVDY